MLKKLLTYISLFLFTAVLAIACVANPTNTTNSSIGSPSPQAKTLNLYNWTTYIDPEVIKQFEQKFSAKIKYDTFESNESLYAKIKAGNPGYDIIVPSDYMVKIMVGDKLVEELNLANIPNRKNLSARFQNLNYDPNNQHSIPYQWGTQGIGYNIKATGGEIDSWAALFDPKYKRRVALQDDLRYTLGVILMYKGFSPNSTNKDEINQAKEVIINNRENILAFHPDTGQDLLAQGQVDLVAEYSGDIFQLMEKNPDIRYVIPKEGTVLWTDNLVIPKGAPNKALAEQFINFILEPEIGAKNSNFIKYASPNQAAIDKGLIDPTILKNPNIYPSPEMFTKLKALEDVGEATKLYDEAWTEVKVSMGK
jgi:spermidine/putrescine transport system substrate-binding protein